MYSESSALITILERPTLCEAHHCAPSQEAGRFLAEPVCWGELEQCSLCGRMVCTGYMLSSEDESDIEGICDNCSARLFATRN